MSPYQRAHTHTHTQRNTSLEQSVARTIQRHSAQINFLLLYFTSKSGRTILIGFLQMSFWWKKDDIQGFFFCMCVYIFFLPSGFHPRRPGTILRESHFLFPPWWLMFFNYISVGSTTRHSQHTDDKGSREKEGLHYIVPAIRRNHRGKKAKRRGWSSFVFKSPDGVRFQCLRLSAEPIGAVYLEEEREDR